MASLTVTGTAAAEPNFPATVDAFIMQPGLVEGLFSDTNPPGCRLCHQNGAVGGVPLTAFGTALGIQSTAPSADELTAALKQLQGTNPRAIQDLEMGMNPNSDPAALSDDPVPEYGCASISGEPARNGQDLASLAFLGLVVLWVWRAKKTKGALG
jgi:hypothetical protein